MAERRRSWNRRPSTPAAAHASGHAGRMSAMRSPPIPPGKTALGPCIRAPTHQRQLGHSVPCLAFVIVAGVSSCHDARSSVRCLYQGTASAVSFSVNDPAALDGASPPQGSGSGPTNRDFYVAQVFDRNGKMIEDWSQFTEGLAACWSPRLQPKECDRTPI